MTPAVPPGAIVVGLDDAPGSRKALAWAARTAVREDRTLAIVTARPWVAPEVLERVVHSLHERRPRLRTVVAADVRGPRTTLVGLSRDAHLLVVGSRRRHPAGRHLGAIGPIGPVAAAVARNATCPVVVVRPDPPATRPDGPVVLAIDESTDPSVVEFAFRCAVEARRPVEVLSCLLDVAAVVSPELRVDDDAHRMRRRLLSDVAGAMRRRFPDVPVTTTLVSGLDTTILVDRSAGASLVVLERPSKNGRTHWFGTSAPAAVLERAWCAVAVVPVPARLHASSGGQDQRPAHA